jgi:glycyl-tRNA synthetase
LGIVLPLCVPLLLSPGVWQIQGQQDLLERAQAIETSLRPKCRTQYDEGDVGQLYRREDEIGTPFCIMVDFQSLDDHAVTARSQLDAADRVARDQLTAYLTERLEGG